MKKWEKYESQILRFIRKGFPGFDIKINQKIEGLLSKQKRQVDVLIIRNKKGKKFIGAVLCKYLNKKVDLVQMESFIGSLEDVGANFGIFISNLGFTKGAKNLASAKHIRLEEVDYPNLDNFDFIQPNELPDIFMQRNHYILPYCKTCSKTFLLQIQEISGFANHENIKCPKCDNLLIEDTRSDGGVKVIHSFKGKLSNLADGSYPPSVIHEIKRIVQETENEWRYWINRDFLNDQSCNICWKEITESYSPFKHPKKDNKLICMDCLGGMRWLVY